LSLIRITCNNSSNKVIVKTNYSKSLSQIGTLVMRDSDSIIQESILFLWIN